MFFKDQTSLLLFFDEVKIQIEDKKLNLYSLSVPAVLKWSISLLQPAAREMCFIPMSLYAGEVLIYSKEYPERSD